MTAADLPLDNQLRTTSHLNDLSNLRRVLVGESLMMDSMVQDSSYSLSEKSKQPHNIETGRDLSNDLEYILTQQYESVQKLPPELRAWMDSLIEGILSRSEAMDPPSGGPDEKRVDERSV